MFSDGCVKIVYDLECKIFGHCFLALGTQRVFVDFQLMHPQLFRFLNIDKKEDMGFENKGGSNGFFKTFCDMDTLFFSLFVFLWSSQTYCRRPFGAPVAMKIVLNEKNMSKIWVDG